ncbi:MAG: DUF6046 domain-containing protein [Bacteroidales bacterium]|jgi:hypothetical protein|nr:DUF6046 domain-containing protein [Bacteroidales bacterium]
MKVNWHITTAGAEKLVKTKLYRLTPVDVSHEQEQGQEVWNTIKVPLVGRLATAADSLSGKNFKDFFACNVICPLVLNGGGKEITIAEAIVTVTKTKTINTTVVVGGKGTVKEFIADQDMKLIIAIFITATDAEGNIIDEYPAEAIAELTTILDAVSIDAWSPFLELFDINGGKMKLIVENYTIAQMTDTNRQSVTINAISDYDYELYAMEE